VPREAVLEVSRHGWTFGDLPMREVRVRHLDDLVDVMLREHGRAASGTRGVIATLSAMFTDAIRDDVAEMNPALYITVRDNDPRVQRPSGAGRAGVVGGDARVRAAAGEYEPMVRVLADCGLRLGELLALECKHVRGDMLVVEQHAWRGVVSPGTKQGDRREVPLPPVWGRCWRWRELPRLPALVRVADAGGRGRSGGPGEDERPHGCDRNEFLHTCDRGDVRGRPEGGRGVTV
jgi:integrase